MGYFSLQEMGEKTMCGRTVVLDLLGDLSRVFQGILVRAVVGENLPKHHSPWGSSSPAHRWELTFLNVMTRFLVPAMHPFSITKSLLTSP